MTDAPCLLLTGGTGFVGRHLAPRLIEMYPGHRRIMMVGDGAETSMPGWEVVSADLTSEPDVDALIAAARPSVVVHMAAQSSVGAAKEAAQATWRVNVLGTLALASAISRHMASGVCLFTSTGEVYGASFLAGPADETAPTAPMNSYAISKLAGEQILRDILPQRFQLIIMRAFNHSGPGQDERFVLASFAAQIARAEAGAGPPIVRVGNLSAERDFLHVVDVVEAYLAALSVRDNLPARTVMNVASGRTYRIEDLLAKLLGLTECAVQIIPDDARQRPSEIPKAAGRAEKLAQLTGWSPKVDIDGLLQDLLNDQRFKQ